MEITAGLNVLGLILIVWTGAAVAQSADPCIVGVRQRLKVSPLSYEKTKTSPNYPQSYNPKTECSWHIEIPSDYSDSHVVKVVFNDFHLEDRYIIGDTRCEHIDSLTFYDGPTSMSNLIGKYCSTVRPDVIYSTGRSMYVKFHAFLFTVSPPRGFSFNYSAVRKEEASAICHPRSYLVSDISRVNGPSGTFFSPGYPAPYRNDAICIWILTVPPGKRVKLRFESFSLRRSYFDCRKGNDNYNDFVEVRDGKTSTNFEIGRYCKYNTPNVPADLFSSDRYMWVKFRSGDKEMLTNVKGFKAHFEAVDQTADINSMTVCFPGNVNNYNLKLAGEKGTLKSPLDLYPPDLNCSWLITVPDGKIVKLVFNRFQLSMSKLSTCGDYVEVLDGKHTSSKRLGKYCGGAKSHLGTLRSSGRYMRVNFVSDSDDLVRDKGFEATFSTVDERNTAHVMMALGLGVSAGVMLLILMVVCLVCNSKRKRARNRAARGTGMSMTTASTSASHNQQPPPPPPQESYQPANTPSVGYEPPPAYPYPDDPPPPYPGGEGVPQYPPPGQPYPWLQKSASAQPTAPPVSL